MFRSTGLICRTKELVLFETASRSEGDFAIGDLGLRRGLLRVGAGLPDVEGRRATLGRKGLLTLELSVVLTLPFDAGTCLLGASVVLALPFGTGVCLGEMYRRDCGLGVGLAAVATSGLGVDTPELERGRVVLVTPDLIDPVVLGMLVRDGLEVIRVDVVEPPAGALALVRGLAEGRALGAKACLRLPVDAVLRFGSPTPSGDLAGSVDLDPSTDLDIVGAAVGGLWDVVGLALLALAPPYPMPNSAACLSVRCRSVSRTPARRRSLSASSFSLE